MDTVMVEGISFPEPRIPRGMENIKESREPRGYCLDKRFQIVSLVSPRKTQSQKTSNPQFK